LIRNLTKKSVSILIIGVIIICIAFFILPVSLPIVLAFITALFLEPLNKMLTKRLPMKHKLSVIVVFLGFLLLLVISIYFLTTHVVTQAIEFVRQTPEYVNEVNDIWRQYESKMQNASASLPDNFVEEVSSQVDNILYHIKNDFGNLIDIKKVSSFIALLPNYLISFIVYLIALFLFMLDLPAIRNRLYFHLSDKTARKVGFMSSRLSFVIFGFLKAQFFVSVLIFLVTLVGLLMIKPETALFTALIIWLFDFIPIIGAIIILGPWTLFNFLTGDIVIATKLAILTGLIIIIRRTVEPKVMGSQIGLSPLTTLISMYLGWQLIGLIGFLIGPFLLISFYSAREAGLLKVEIKG
jgi:sporulation integral membrane protein YtvI